MAVLHNIKNQEEKDKILVKQRILKTLKMYFGTKVVTRIAEKTNLPPLLIYRYFKRSNGNAVIEEEILTMLREAQAHQQALIEAQEIEKSISGSHVD
jgi:hypothetical protein